MDKIAGFLIIAAFYFVGNALSVALSLPIPSSIVGMLLLLLMLSSGIIPARLVRSGCTALIGIMPLFFIPASMGLINHFETFKTHFFSLIGSTVISTILVLVVVAIVIDRKAKD
ncbi:CidA/LrgA family protein [Veronia pacifica]|uniref:Antiholin LrgA n=1 Tax=Veronia pacifica TaxID=1080227 RepID=A0A1C3EE11_9GAMM|nr:CidA/LrgA family protein [Veronia pacifica]ODA31478.1 antiholin LrgA [Veronia pacifica]